MGNFASQETEQSRSSRQNDKLTVIYVFHNGDIANHEQHISDILEKEHVTMETRDLQYVTMDNIKLQGVVGLFADRGFTFSKDRKDVPRMLHYCSRRLPFVSVFLVKGNSDEFDDIFGDFAQDELPFWKRGTNYEIVHGFAPAALV